MKILCRVLESKDSQQYRAVRLESLIEESNEKSVMIVANSGNRRHHALYREYWD